MGRWSSSVSTYSFFDLELRDEFEEVVLQQHAHLWWDGDVAGISHQVAEGGRKSIQGKGAEGCFDTKFNQDKDD